MVVRTVRAARRGWRGRRLIVTAVLVACLVTLPGGWLGARAWQIRADLAAAADLAARFSQQVLAGDRVGAERTLEQLRDRTGAARAGSADPVWRLATLAPYAGRDPAAVRAVAVAVDDLARLAAPELLAIDPDGLLPVGGRIDVAGLRAAQSRVAAADAAIQRVRATLDRAPAGAMLPQLRSAVRDLRRDVDRVAEMTAGLRHTGAVLPALLGASGPRSHLLVSQNLAEPRATGGIFGAYAEIRAENGRLRMVNQGTGGAITYFDPPLRRLSDDMRGLYGDLPAIYPGDVNLTPHFPTAASLYRQMYRQRTGRTVDTVLATDPVALSYLLRATGPVAVPGHPTLTAGSAVHDLLAEAYLRLDESGQAQDDYFAAAASAVFDAVLTRPVRPRALAEAMRQAVAERRLMMWSAVPAEQAHLSRTPLAGELPAHEEVPTVGVFLNDGTGGKLGYYLERAVELAVGACQSDGRRELRLRLTLGSTAPAGELTKSVLGLGMAGPYVLRTLVFVFSPAGGAVVAARLDGAAAPLGAGTERGRHVGIATVDLPPGRTRVLEVTLLTPVTTTGSADLWLTPAIRSWDSRVHTAPACDR